MFTLNPNYALPETAAETHTPRVDYLGRDSKNRVGRFFSEKPKCVGKNQPISLIITIEIEACVYDSASDVCIYLYANASPSFYTDPTGKFSLIETVSVGAAIGTLAGLANISYRAVAKNEIFTFRQVLLEQLRNAGVGAVSGGIAFKFAAVFQPFVKAGVIGNFGLGTGVATSTGFSTAVINEMIDIFVLRKPFSIRDSGGNVLQATVVSFVTGGFITRITAESSRGEQFVRTTPKPGGGFDTSIDVVVGFGDTLRNPAVTSTATSTASGELGGGALGFLVEKAVEAVYNLSVGD